MNRRLILRNVAIIVVFVAVALTIYSENVRTIQIVGLFVCGMVSGVALGAIISAFRSKQPKT